MERKRLMVQVLPPEETRNAREFRSPRTLHQRQCDIAGATEQASPVTKSEVDRQARAPSPEYTERTPAVARLGCKKSPDKSSAEAKPLRSITLPATASHPLLLNGLRATFFDGRSRDPIADLLVDCSPMRAREGFDLHRHPRVLRD